jgi:DNA recombination protein RmuC
VVLFIPGEAFLAPALDRDPALLEYAMRRRVHIATPTTLVTMLRTASYAWQQAALSRNARAVFDLGKELYERLGTLGGHVDELGRSLTNAIKAYNRTVGSLETRVLVSARKLNDLGVIDAPLGSPGQVEEGPRAVSAPELATSEPANNGLTSQHANGTAGSRRPGMHAQESDTLESGRSESSDGPSVDREKDDGRPDSAAEPVGFARRAVPERDEGRERWP